MVPAFIIAEQHGYILPSSATFGELLKSGFQDQLHIMLTVIGTLSSYGPLIAALILAAMEGELRVWWQRVTRWRVGAGGYRDLLLVFLAVFTPLILLGIALGPLPAAGSLATPLAFFMVYTLYELLSSGMEEPGWRGYALPRLQERYNASKSSLIVGLVWGVWHWPAFIPLYFNLLRTPGTPVIAAIIQTAMQALIYIFASILAAAFIETWLFNRTQSALINLIHHGGSNAVGGVMMALIPNPGLGMLYGIVRWVVAIALLRFFWQEKKV
jgi:uncharacterized protein